MNRHLDNQKYSSSVFKPGVLAGPHDNALRAAVNHTYSSRAGGGSARAARPASQAWADEWMAKHPAVYPMFERFALEVASRRSRFSAKAIIERLRWEHTVQGGSDFKIANAVTRYMAERFVREHPEHATLFLLARKGGAR